MGSDGDEIPWMLVSWGVFTLGLFLKQFLGCGQFIYIAWRYFLKCLVKKAKHK